MATFFKFGKLWDIPPAAARLGANLPANKRTFETLLTDLEPMLSEFIAAHPRCPAHPDLPAIRYALKQFMEEGPISNPLVERWKATYNPAKKTTYCSWFLSTIIHFLDKLDFTTLTPPPIELKPWVFIVDPRKTSIDPFPPPQPIAPSSPPSAAKPARKSRDWNAGGPAGLAALEARKAAERQALLRHAPRKVSSAWAQFIDNADDGHQSD
jgi:hypothetical protein